eukprot:scaffold99393_cov63-Phaeocystis_antarctica.AAC.3
MAAAARVAEAERARAAVEGAAARQHAQNAPLGSAPAWPLRLLRAHLAALASSTLSGAEVAPMSAPPLPRVLEPAASKVAESAALFSLGAG